MNPEQYIEHEIKLRVQKETTDVRFLEMQKTTDSRFSFIENKLNRIENKINWILGVSVTSIIIPSLLKLTRFL